MPTPYSIKLSLIDAAIQTGQVAEGERLFELLKGRPVRIRPPASAVVSGAFVRIQKLGRDPTVGFREYVQFLGRGDGAAFAVAIAADGTEKQDRALIARAAIACSYWGKRGSFVRFIPSLAGDEVDLVSSISPEAPYTLPNSVWQSIGTPPIQLGTLQPLDELPSTAKWSSVSTFSQAKITAILQSEQDKSERMRADRVFVHTLIPYKLIGSSRGYAYYRRIEVRKLANLTVSTVPSAKARGSL